MDNYNIHVNSNGESNHKLFNFLNLFLFNLLGNNFDLHHKVENMCKSKNTN